MRFVRPGYRLTDGMFLPDGEFLAAGTPLDSGHLLAFAQAGVPWLCIESTEQVKSWEKVPSLTEFMMTLDERFRGLESPQTQILRCAIEDVYSRFLFEIESDEDVDGR